ncbi:hypothetical protein TorRG33x02_071890, partial [Trema orientale]
ILNYISTLGLYGNLRSAEPSTGSRTSARQDDGEATRTATATKRRTAQSAGPQPTKIGGPTNRQKKAK